MPSSPAVLEKQNKALLDKDEVRLLNAYWHAANYLCVGMIEGHKRSKGSNMCLLGVGKKALQHQLKHQDSSL